MAAGGHVHQLHCRPAALELEPVIHPVLRKPLIAYCLLWAIVSPGALYSFFATFPEPTPIDKRLPWLKVALLGCPLLVGAWFAVVTLVSSETPSYLRPQGLSEVYETRLAFALGMYSLAGYGFGFASLAWNAFGARPEIRRRTQVMLWGTAGALLPLLAVGTYAAARGLSYIDVPFWLWVGPLLALYATLFFGVYDEPSSRLRYVNCGHLPPVLLGSDGSIEHLLPTAPVIGLFEGWSCDTREVHLKCNDTLVMFTDGVVEALDAADQEFGEDRLVALVRQDSSLSAATVVEHIAREVQRYSGSALWDDLTLVVARARACSSSANR